MVHSEQTINIENAIRNSDNKLIRSLPRFAINILRKIIYEDELNSSLNRSRHLEGVPFMNHVLEGWNVKIVVKGEENIPVTGRFIFASNHPVGGIDAMAFFSVIYRHFPEVVSPANRLLNYIPNLRPLFLGLDVFGRVSKETVKKIDELFASDKQVMIFPAGEVSRRQKGVISDIVWQKSFITKAIP
ncbi:MAG: 1-acyl-sn-glycerol-3-phosphate acyltransferase [Bacteroidales bacterium]